MIRGIKLFLIIILIVPSIPYSPIRIEQDGSTEPEYLDGWRYRKGHWINGSEGAGTNYPVSIQVYYGSGTDSGNKVYCNEKCNDSFVDASEISIY